MFGPIFLIYFIRHFMFINMQHLLRQVLKYIRMLRKKYQEHLIDIINLLKSGGSKYPVDQAKEAGVDFTKKDAYMAVVERMDNLVEELEKLLNA